MQSYDHLKKEHRDHLRFLLEKYLNLLQNPESVKSISGYELVVFEGIIQVLNRYNDGKSLVNVEHFYSTVLDVFSIDDKLSKIFWNSVEKSYDLQKEKNAHEEH
jgi:hypothetical protein